MSLRTTFLTPSCILNRCLPSCSLKNIGWIKVAQYALICFALIAVFRLAGDLVYQAPMNQGVFDRCSSLHLNPTVSLTVTTVASPINQVAGKICEAVFMQQSIPCTEGGVEQASQLLSNTSTKTHEEAARQAGHEYSSVQVSSISIDTAAFWKDLLAKNKHLSQIPRPLSPTFRWTVFLTTDVVVFNPNQINALSYVAHQNLSMVMFQPLFSRPLADLILVRQDADGNQALKNVVSYIEKNRYFSEIGIKQKIREFEILDLQTIANLACPITNILIINETSNPDSIPPSTFGVIPSRFYDNPCNVGARALRLHTFMRHTLPYWKIPVDIFDEWLTRLRTIQHLTLPQRIVNQFLYPD